MKQSIWIILTSPTFHSIGLILFRLEKNELFNIFIEDLVQNGMGILSLKESELLRLNEIAKKFNLDFDDAYQYVCAVKKILLSFIGDNDCYPFEKKGPILSILSKQKFDKVYLLYNKESYLKPASDIFCYCEIHFPEITIVYQEAPAINPTDYNTVYPSMYKAVKEIIKQNKSANYTISLTSGTPTMHACWIFLQQGGVIKANLIQISRDGIISEVNFNLDDFPHIKKVGSIKTEISRLARENVQLKQRLKLQYDHIIGECPEILKVKEQIQLFSETPIPIFISGETGTGKELVAEAIHFNSQRKENRFVPINCGAIPANLFESELFGHKKGAFTGAIAEKEGKFMLADKGTIFLDEIVDLPLDMQVKLLRVLQEGVFIPVGATREIKVDVRVISATNQDIKKAVKEGKFREDLFYRLVHTEINLPPLRLRGNDKILIANHIMQQLNHKYGTVKTLTESAMSKLLAYDWPGNIRQLKNCLETGYQYTDDKIEARHLNFIDIESQSTKIEISNQGVDLDNEILPLYYHAALEKTNGNAEQAAKLLKLEPHTFRARLRKLKGKDFYGER
ncbi:MAG TPA: sigma-54-dependent Fis family transcriptional regulator [bacterium]|nr:sigma-54-dependent Fis family transcriptional regulator [bacterium]